MGLLHASGNTQLVERAFLRYNIVAHPTISELRQHRNTLRQLIGALKLAPLDPDGYLLTDDVAGFLFTDGGLNRPRTRSEVGKMGAAARWGNRHGK